MFVVFMGVMVLVAEKGDACIVAVGGSAVGQR